MRVLLAFDKFKGTLTAPEACGLAARAVRARHRDWQVDPCPLSDGGDGFTEILVAAAGGESLRVDAAGPRGGLVAARLGLIGPRRIPPAALAVLGLPEASTTGGRPLAVIEAAAASGLATLPPDQRDPWQATSYGTGQLIRAAAEAGAGAVVLGLGGSATIDLGLGALAALGLEFREATGARIRTPVPAHWPRIASVEGEVFPSIPPIRLACDVTNPLLGPHGAAAVYGPQKGLRPADLPALEASMARLADLLCQQCGQPSSLAASPGAGAAGGLAFGLMAAARASTIPGFELVAAWLDLAGRIAAADLVLTGEGCFDATSLAGKGPGAIVAQARALGKEVHVFAGQLGADLPPSLAHLHAITPPTGATLPTAAETSARLVACIQEAL